MVAILKIGFLPGIESATFKFEAGKLVALVVTFPVNNSPLSSGKLILVLAIEVSGYKNLKECEVSNFGFCSVSIFLTEIE